MFHSQVQRKENLSFSSLCVVLGMALSGCSPHVRHAGPGFQRASVLPVCWIFKSGSGSGWWWDLGVGRGWHRWALAFAAPLRVWKCPDFYEMRFLE